MLTQSAAARLAGYKLWADELTYDAVSVLGPGEAHRERATLFGSIINTLNHSYVVDLIWRAHLEGQQHGFSSRRVILHEHVQELRQAQRSFNQWLEDWCGTQTDESLCETISVRFISGDQVRMSRGAIVFHVVNHATYHRGYVSDLLHQTPATAPTTDFCVFPGIVTRTQ